MRARQDLIFDETPHVADYAEQAVRFMIETKRYAEEAAAL